MVNTTYVYDWYYNSSFNSPLIILLIIIIIGTLLFVFNKFYIKKYNIGSFVSNTSFLYTKNNNNSYILLTIIVLLILLIISMNWYLQKKDIKDKFNEVLPYITNPTDNFKIDLTNELNKMEVNSGTVIEKPIDLYVNQLTSTLYGDDDFKASYDNGGNSSTSNVNIMSANGINVADYATLDSLGKSLTDNLGGIDTQLGFTVIDEQIGTFKGSSNTDFTYNNIANYNSTLNNDNIKASNDNNIIPTNGYKKAYSGSPIFLQKDFEGVANIFAPNIFISEGSNIPNIYMNDKLIN